MRLDRFSLFDRVRQGSFLSLSARMCRWSGLHDSQSLLEDGWLGMTPKNHDALRENYADPNSAPFDCPAFLPRSL